MKRSLYLYIKKNVNDKYIMDALYYCLRKTIIKIVFNGGNMKSFNISTRFIIDPIELELSVTEHKDIDILRMSFQLCQTLRQ